MTVERLPWAIAVAEWRQAELASNLEMGFLGSQQRRTDPMSGLVQMGARSYAPELGAFLSEDPVLGVPGIGISANRYPYAWDNPLTLYDLDGRFPSPSDIADAVGDTAEDAVETARDVVDTGTYIVAHPREAATNAANYWAGDESGASYIFGPLSILGDMALNPDRFSYYQKNVSLAQMTATGLAAAFTAGAAIGTGYLTAGCWGAVAGLEVLHVCTGVSAFGWGLVVAGGSATVGIASQ